MKQGYSLVISILIHLFIVVVFLLLDIESIIKEEDEVLKITFIKKSEIKKTISKSLESDMSISQGAIKKLSSISAPERSHYLESSEITENAITTSDNYTLNYSKKSVPSSSDFESSLSELSSMNQDFLEEDSSNDVSISWDGEERTSTTNTTIDFSTFPESSFTGVGVTAVFLVNKSGDVYSVEIEPPGSGSVEFDILIKQYVSKFTFSPSDSVSRGEVFIVYKK